MSEYIDREKLVSDIKIRYCKPCEDKGRDYKQTKCRACWVDDMIDEIEGAPTAEAAVMKHGKWENIPLNMDSSYFAYKINLRKKCTACHYAMPQEWPNFNICPNCGAKMDLEE